MLLRCFSKTWFNLGEFTLFWRKLQNVAKYAFLVLLFWAKIFICAIFYAYSISGCPVTQLPRYPVIQLSNSKHDTYSMSMGGSERHSVKNAIFFHTLACLIFSLKESHIHPAQFCASPVCYTILYSSPILYYSLPDSKLP